MAINPLLDQEYQAVLEESLKNSFEKVSAYYEKLIPEADMIFFAANGIRDLNAAYAKKIVAAKPST
jgi:hypothetical protein